MNGVKMRCKNETLMKVVLLVGEFGARISENCQSNNRLTKER